MIESRTIVPIVFSILLVVLLIPIISDIYETTTWTNEEVVIPTGWQYDDYQVADSNVASVSGAIELVDLAGTTYIHANDVGEGVITYNDSSTETITVNKAILDFYCINGQSNACYRQVIEETNPATANPYPARGEGYFIDMLTYHHTPIPWYDANGDPNVGNIPPSFVATYYEQTHHKVLVNFTGVSGRSILKFQPDQEMYNRTLSAMSGAYSDFYSDTEHYILGKKVMIWIQGEADDAYMTSSEYYDYFMTFWNGIQEDSPYPFDYCMISYLTSNFTTITEADTMLINNNLDIYLGSKIAQTFTNENGLLKGDGVHYSQAGRNALGESLSEKAVYLLGHQKTQEYNSMLAKMFDIIPLFIVLALIVGIASRLYTKPE